MLHPPTSSTIGWRPSCVCYDSRYRAEFPQARSVRKRAQRHAWGDWWRRVRQRPGRDSWPVEPQTVLDPFAGAGTTLLVADRLWRHGIGCDLKAEYTQLSVERLRNDAPLFLELLT